MRCRLAGVTGIKSSINMREFTRPLPVPIISALYKRPLQVSRYLRQFPSPRSPNWSLLRQACRNSAHASLRTGRWQVSRYLRQFPSPRSPSTSLFSQARRNCSHSPPRTRTPPGPISTDWEKAETGITKRAAAAAAPNAHFRIPCNISDPPVGVGRSIETPLRRPLSRPGDRTERALSLLAIAQTFMLFMPVSTSARVPA